MRQDVRDASGTTSLVVGVSFFLAGVAVVSVGLGWIRVDPDSVHAPGWVIALCGGVFVLLGGMILFYAVRNALREPPARPDRRRGSFFVAGWLVGGLVVTTFAVVAAWIAFGPGERPFSGSFGLGGVSIRGTTFSDETAGRAVFGLGAVLTGAFAVWGWLYGIRRLLRGGEAGARARGGGRPGEKRTGEKRSPPDAERSGPDPASGPTDEGVGPTGEGDRPAAAGGAAGEPLEAAEPGEPLDGGEPGEPGG